MGNGLPSLPFFTSDFLTAVAAWPTERVGAYCLALFYQWEHGCVPVGDGIALGLILHASPVRARKLWNEIAGKFHVEGDEARNVRLEEHRQEVQAMVEASEARGRKGARARWHKHRLSTAQAHTQASGKDSLSNSNQNQNQNQTQDLSVNTDPDVIGERVSPAPTRAHEPGAAGGSYLSQSRIAYNHRGHTLNRGPHFDAFVDRFGGDTAAFVAWLDERIDACYDSGGRPGQMFKFIDEQWEKRGTTMPKQTVENVANLQGFLNRRQR